MKTYSQDEFRHRATRDYGRESSKDLRYHDKAGNKTDYGRKGSELRFTVILRESFSCLFR